MRVSSYSLLSEIYNLIDVDRNATMVFAYDHFEHFAQNTREVFANPRLLVLLNQLNDFSPLLDNNDGELFLCTNLIMLFLARWQLAASIPLEERSRIFIMFQPLLLRFKALELPGAEYCYETIFENTQSRRAEVN